MRKLEQNVSEGRQKAFIQKALLGTLLVGGALVAPAAMFAALSAIGILTSGGHARYPSRLRRSLVRLLDDGYVEFTKDGKKYVRITDKGRKYLAKLEGNQYKLEKPKSWDKHYRVVIFDIKEKRKYTRERLREILTQIGFMQLQKSVWVYPYDCEEVITMIKTDFKIGKDILYMIVKEIEYDKPIRDYFKLPWT